MPPTFLSGLLHISVDKEAGQLIDSQFQSQSQRGDNQQNQPRPGSGYGAAAAHTGASGASVGAGTDPSASTTYQGQEEGVNNILNPHGLDPSQPQAGPFGSVYPPASTNNGVGTDPY